jgi:16S rRNA (guanine1207-N2)-methyltransferase
MLLLHCGTGLAGAAVAHHAPDGQITLIDSHVVAARAAQRTLEANQIAHAAVLLGDCAQPVHDQTFDYVLAHLPKGRAAWQQTILDASRVLTTGGAFYLAGATRTGIKSAAKYVKQVFGEVSVLGYRGGCRILCATKSAQLDRYVPGAADDYYRWRTIETVVAGQALAYASKPGIFAWKSLDAGTRLLIETLQTHPLRPGDRVWDIGSGGGPLTLVAARQADRGTVVATDVDWRAGQATQRTITLNKLHNAEIKLGDCAEALDGRTFSAVLTNPPFHQARATTYAIVEQIIREAARLLDPGGRMLLVANSFLQYKPLIHSAFGNAQLLAETRGFKIWQATQE